MASRTRTNVGWTRFCPSGIDLIVVVCYWSI